jgi:hypothetical protein
MPKNRKSANCIKANKRLLRLLLTCPFTAAGQHALNDYWSVRVIARVKIAPPKERQKMNRLLEKLHE